VNSSLIDFAEIKKRLKQVWPGFQADKEFLTGEQILQNLF
jgi:hypothetical protein